MFELRVDGFHGPFDLLLSLIEREKLDITGISLAQVADQYWQYVQSQQDIEAETLAEFIGIGARLLYLKSCALLPQPASESDVSSDERHFEDEGDDLVQLLAQYKRIRDAALLFRQLEEEGRKAYSRSAPPGNVPLPDSVKGLSLDALLTAVQEALLRKPQDAEQDVLEVDPITINAKIGELADSLSKSRGRLSFNRLLASCQTRTEVVVFFLAVLELIKLGRLWAEQGESFGEILLVEAAAGTS
ncbi:MAG TPA: ScpA family protein [Dehalococcoidia bacterium]|nr:ScpA family protein [Dehalococcoidia bacterium]